MPSDFDSEWPAGQPTTLDQPPPSADDSVAVEGQTPAPDPPPEWLILLLRHNAPLMRFGH